MNKFLLVRLSIQNLKLLRLCFCFFLFIDSFGQKAVPELWGTRVHDEAHVLKQETVDQLEKELKVYEDTTSNQIAILIVQSLDGDVLEQYSLKVAEKWKLGKKDKDNGVLLLVAVDNHKMRIEVGQGLEGVLTDAQSSRIIRNEIAPEFRRGNYDDGIIAGINTIIKVIGGEYKADSASSSNNLSIIDWIMLVSFTLAILGIVTITAFTMKGGTGWRMYFFLLLFYVGFGWIPFGTFSGGLWMIIFCAVAALIFRLVLKHTAWGRSMQKDWASGKGSGWLSGWTSGGSSLSSGGSSSFSGGGGSFGGGGSSGSW